MDGLRRGGLCPFFLAARIGEVEVRTVLRSRYLAEMCIRDRHRAFAAQLFQIDFLRVVRAVHRTAVQEQIILPLRAQNYATLVPGKDVYKRQGQCRECLY